MILQLHHTKHAASLSNETGEQNASLQLTTTDLVQIDGCIFFQQRWIYSGIAENCNSRSATTESHVYVPGHKVREGECFI